MEGGIALPLESSSVAEVAVTCGSNDVADKVEKSSSMAAGVLSMDLMEVQRQQILAELQVTINSYNDSFRSLSLLRADVEILRRENEALWGENFELSLLLQKQRSNFLAPTHEGCGILDPTSILPQIAGDENVPPGKGIITGNEMSEVVGVVPKSISIRSKGFLAVDQAPGRGGGITEDASASGDIIPRNFQPLPLGSVQVGETDGVGIEVEVFNQGVAKTELCNKWEEMGWCPYGDQCQFAHGVDELRPVIRHPRYKTQLCRMVSGPGGCPYGHRCHFRHAQHTPSSQ